MKFLLLLILILFTIVSFHETAAQPDKSKNSELSARSDSINIRALIQNQIEQIKKKEVGAEDYKTAPDEVNKDTQSAGFSNDILLKLFAIIDIALVVVMYLLWRRRKIKIENVKTGRLKRNILKLRGEKIGSKENRHLSKIRKQLKLDPAFKYADDNYITSYAKKMSVSKGELYLAAKLNSFLREDNGRTSY